MAELIVVRHGQSTADIEPEKRLEGRTDNTLTELGVRQAERAAEWIARTCRPDRIMYSPLQRASATAARIAGQTGAYSESCDDLMEWNNGVLAGMLLREADLLYAEPPGGRKPHEPVQDGESTIDFRFRVERLWSRLFHETNGSAARTCVVAHGGTIRKLFQCFMQLPVDSQAGLSTADTGIHIWRYNGAERHLVRCNSTEHLIER